MDEHINPIELIVPLENAFTIQPFRGNGCMAHQCNTETAMLVVNSCKRHTGLSMMWRSTTGLIGSMSVLSFGLYMYRKDKMTLKLIEPPENVFTIRRLGEMEEHQLSVCDMAFFRQFNRFNEMYSRDPHPSV